MHECYKHRPVGYALIFTFFSLFILGSVSVYSQTLTPKYISMTANTYGYWEYLPYNYSAGGSHPLLIHTGGLYENGNGTSDIGKMLWTGPAAMANQGRLPSSFTVNGQSFSFIIITPQFVDWPNAIHIQGVIDYAVSHYRVDLSRIYLDGISQGGGVTWEYAGASLANANRLAAIVPACGAIYPDRTRANNISAANLPVWAIHNLGDPTVPVSYTIDMINFINNPLAKKTTPNINDHDTWSYAYDANWRENGKNIYEWMLSYSRGGSAPPPPPPTPPTPPAPTYPAPLPNEPGPLKYKYYTYAGTWNNLPVIQSLNPTSSGTLSNITISPKTQADQFAFLWEGYINIPTTGSYTFRIASDDGSQLWFGSLAGPLINNDGLHAVQEKEATITLNAGVYPIAAIYYDQAYTEVMYVTWKTPETGGNFVQIPNSAFVNAPVTPPPTPPTPPTAGPLRYRYYTYSGTWYNMPVLHSLNPTATGTVNDITLANRTQNDRFAYLWEGYLNIPVSGSYTFRTTSDDGSQFWLGSYPGPIVLNDGIHGPQDREGTVTLSAGVYPIAVLYFEQEGGETMILSWKTPQTGGAYVQVPSSAYVAAPASTPPTTSAGLNYKYYTYKGTWTALPDFNALTPVSTGKVANVLITPKTQNDNFAFMWSGFITVPTTGTYTFRTNSDDGSKLYIGGNYSYSATALVNNDGLHAGQDRDGSIALTAGTPYPITVTFFEQDSREFIDVFWKTPSSNTFVVIPDNVFTSSSSLQDDGSPLDEAISAFNSSSARKASGDEDVSASVKTGLTTIGANALSIFPNPAVDRVNLQLTHAEKGAVQVSIMNAQGTVLQNKRLQKGSAYWNQQVNVSNLKPGYYIIQVKGKTLDYKQSFIKK